MTAVEWRRKGQLRLEASSDQFSHDMTICPVK